MKKTLTFIKFDNVTRIVSFEDLKNPVNWGEWELTIVLKDQFTNSKEFTMKVVIMGNIKVPKFSFTPISSPIFFDEELPVLKPETVILSGGMEVSLKVINRRGLLKLVFGKVLKSFNLDDIKAPNI